MDQYKKVVLAYSGGLDTSVILRWLQETYRCDVVTYTADLGQGAELDRARDKARKMGVNEIFVDDIREEFVSDFVFPMFRCNAVYEGEYLLGTSIARPLISKRLVEVAEETSSDAIAHGATGKGNDQVRFELGIHALGPNISVIAPWREWELTSREALLQFCEKHQISVDMKSEENPSPYSMDSNLLHISYEGGVLEDPSSEPIESMWQWTKSIESTPDSPTELEIEFQKGDPIAINGRPMKSHEILAELNYLGGKNGVGRIDIVENRYVGMKARGCYETPGGTILLKAHRAIESITLDREVIHLKDEVMPRYASLIYNGYWWSPERKALQALINQTQKPVNGTVRMKLLKGNVIVIGRESKTDSLYDNTIVTFEDDFGSYDQSDASGFIKLNALRLKLAAQRGRKF